MLELFRGVVWRDHLPGLLRLIATLLLLLVSLGYNLHVRSELGVVKANNWVQQDQIAQAVSARELLNENIDAYLSHRSDGAIGDVQRLEWVETLRAIAGELNLPNVKFTLEESRTVQQGDDPNAQPGVAMRVTPMRIDMQLTHEGDFHRLLSELRDQAPGIFSVETCKVSWLPPERALSGLTRFRGVCDLSWYTLFDITDTWGKDA
ncbi:MAG: hypothetical protein AAGI24_02660 [Pseudomonadota bacterium]